MQLVTMTVSMLVSLLVYAWAFGWQFAIGFILLLVIHEFGHIVASYVVGIRTSQPIFLPFVGALIHLHQPPRNAKMEANVAIGGPAAGTLSALFCLAVFLWTNSGLMLILTLMACIINLFNLIPLAPLDGGRIAGAISPRMWILGDIVLAVLSVYLHNIILLFIFVLSMGQLWCSGGSLPSEFDADYFMLSSRQRWRVAWWYFGLLIILGTTTLYVFTLLS